jgi:hypothetical protein
MKDRDFGFSEILKRLKALKNKQLHVGILEGSGDNEDGQLIAGYAYSNEYGTEHIPARSFMRSTFDEKNADWNKALNGVVEQVASGESIDVQRAVGLVGEQVASDIKDKISSNVPPPLKEATRVKKKSSKTLVDTGIMRNSINFKIVDK